MSTTITAPRPSAHLTTGGILRSEWIKLRSVRSTIWSYGIIVVVSVGMALLLSSTIDFGGQTPPPEAHQILALQTATFGIYMGQLIVAVLGVLVISGEYATGMIRSTLTAVPKRIPALAAKTFVLFVATFLLGLVSTFGALLVALPILAGKGIEVDLTALAGNLVLASVYLALVAVFALGLGSILRSSAGGIAAALGVILLLPTIFQVVAGLTGAQWAIDMMPYLFSTAGTGMFTPTIEGAEGLLQWQSALVVVAWAAVSLVGGALLLKRRDA
ncbi:ABC transporter permease subunit [Salinibacterium sp. ZJ454]|uniref:ABC transporter permease subunit n=1 Tax=Salinibacterium sp. ZJ454 TaxID=2708339 RepID=UPI00141ED6F1|nr:ABC transporter permease subunit [Salinibacterium sp. ZJ454]